MHSTYTDPKSIQLMSWPIIGKDDEILSSGTTKIAKSVWLRVKTDKLHYGKMVYRIEMADGRIGEHIQPIGYPIPMKGLESQYKIYKHRMHTQNLIPRIRFKPHSLILTGTPDPFFALQYGNIKESALNKIGLSKAFHDHNTFDLKTPWGQIWGDAEDALINNKILDMSVWLQAFDVNNHLVTASSQHYINLATKIKTYYDSF